MQYKVVISHVSTHETRRGIINHSNIFAFARRLALHNWLLVEHSNLIACAHNESKEVSIGKEGY